MLKKFIAIKNVGTFRNSAASGDAELKKLTLVHAENGRGKTTLCAILRSFQCGDSNLIAERKTLDSTDAPRVELLLDSGPVVFKNGLWTATCHQIEIFDAAFVADNVYSGDSITHDHKRNLCRVVLGADGVLLAKTFDELDTQVRADSVALSAAKDSLQKFAPTDLTIDQYVAIPHDPDIDREIAEKKVEVNVLAGSGAIQQKAILTSLELPQPPSTLTATLQKTIDGISSDAERMVRKHLDTHSMDSRGETWLSDGLRYVTGDACPLCGQDLHGSAIIESFRTFFSHTYRSFQQELSRFVASVDQPLSDTALLAVQRKISDNTSLADFWKQYTSAAPPSLSFDDRVAPVIRGLRDALAPLVRKKLDSPLEPVAYSVEARQAIDAWTKLRDEVTAYNDRVTAFNTTVTAIKAATAARTPIAVQKELDKLMLQKGRHDPGTIALVTAYHNAKTQKASTEVAKDKAKDALDAYNANVVGKYRETVNKLLHRFGAKFALAKVKVEYTGRTPRTAYTFEIRGKEIEPGSDKTPPGTACFRNTLSAGDRNTLALAFFIAQLKNRTDLATLVLVFDDPFTSLDSFRQAWTCNTIRTLSSEAQQVIVLSHSLHFLRLLATGCDASNVKSLQIDRHGTSDSHIIALDLEDATATAVENDVVTLRSFYTGDHKDAQATIRTIRPLLEHHLRKMAPDQCPKGNGWLGTFLGDIRKAAAQSPLGLFKPLYDDLDNLNQYTSPHAHDSGMAPAIDNTELQTQVVLVLTLIGRM